MTNKLILLIMMMNLFTVNPTNHSIDNDLGQAHEYFPDRAIIKTFYNESQDYTTVYTMDKIVDNKMQVKSVDPDQRLVQLYTVEEDKITLINYQDIEGEGFEDDYISSMDAKYDIVILKGPLTVGTQWISEGAVATITDTNVKITTPAGEFNTIEVTFEYDDYNFVDYYAKNIGIVKTLIGKYASEELVKIEYLE